MKWIYYFVLFQPNGIFTIVTLQEILHLMCIRCTRLLLPYSQVNKIKSLSSNTFKKKIK